MLTSVAVCAQVSTNSFVNWETPPLHPIALSPDGAKLVVCNLPDNRLEVFGITNGIPMPLGSISVGLDPCTARFFNQDEVWVANFISDSISIVSLSGMRVVATLGTSNEPSDIVFVGSSAALPPPQAYVSCAQSGLIQAFDVSTRAWVTNIVVDGNRPKAMAVGNDGVTVYAAIFESGNQSTIIGSGVSLGFPIPTPVDFPDSPYAGQNPPPNNGTNFVPAINPGLGTNIPPRAGLIVKKNNAGRWMDDNNADWTEYISGTNSAFTGRLQGWDLPDHDIAVINSTTRAVTYVSNLMNICMDVAVNPASGKVTVIGTEALNHIRFEPVLNGKFVRVELAMVNPVTSTNQVKDLNPHLDYLTPTIAEFERNKSIGDPRGIIWNANGDRGYITGMGSDNLIVVDGNGQRIPGTNAVIALGKGPTGMALDDTHGRLYVWNRFDATISVINTVTLTVIVTVPVFDPTPAAIKLGRPNLYDTHKTSGLGQAACGSCHVDVRFDRLAWDLGDQTGIMKNLTNANFGRQPPAITNNFHPMKGPTTTQTLQDIMGHEPFHWRGDRDGLEDFNGTFTNLQGAVSSLTTNEMQQFKDFLATVRFAPNPFRTVSNTLPTNLPLPGFKALGHGIAAAGGPLPNGNAIAGMTNRFRAAGNTGCIHCHTLPAGLGTDLRWTGSQWITLPTGPHGEHHASYAAIERSSILPFKIQSLRNLFDKQGLDFLSTNNRAGFGLFHDGSVDTLVRFVQDGFDLRTDQETADIVAFLLAFTGSDLPPGVLNDPDRPPGISSGDTHAAVGRQITISNSASVPLIDALIAIATPLTSRVDLVVKGSKDGIPRGWFFNRTNGLFQSDRAAETMTPAALRALAAIGNEHTYTAVPRESGKRIGIDRDGDGYFDRDELDFGSDPTNPLSLATNRPPAIASITNRTVFAGQTITFTASATDPDIPAQQLTFSLGSAPAGATIGPTNGLFTWTPDATQAPSTNLINVLVTDNGTPNRSNSTSFTITVLALLVSAPTFDTNGTTLSWTAIPGQSYRVQFKTNLDDPAWIDLFGSINATNSVISVTDPAIYSQRFYRLLLNQ